jgi:hypothetical protein
MPDYRSDGWRAWRKQRPRGNFRARKGFRPGGTPSWEYKKIQHRGSILWEIDF